MGMSDRFLSMKENQESMKIINSTAWPDYFVRRMVSWCCKHLEYPVREIREIKLENRKRWPIGGRAFLSQRRLVVRIPCTEVWEGAERGFRWAKDQTGLERTRELVRVTAHEIAHLMLDRIGVRSRRSRRTGKVSRGGSEQQTIWHENYVVARFDAD